MKIGVNSRIFQHTSTGIPYYIQCLYQQLLTSNKDFQFTFFQTSKKKKLGQTRIIATNDTGIKGALFDLFLINKLIKKEGVKVFHGASNILPFFKIPGVKYVVTVHDLAFMITPKGYPLAYRLFSKYGIRRSVKNADVIVADSNNTKKDIIKFFHADAKKIKTVYLGVNDVFCCPSRHKRIIQDKYFFSITSHPQRKNILSVLEVFACNENLKNYKYVVAGAIEPVQMAELKEKIRQLGLNERVIIFGYASEKELVNLYQNAEFFIFPSFYEGFGFPVVEAMICRCPVITSQNSSLIELMPDKRWLVNPHSLRSISMKIDKLLSLSAQERKKLIENNYQFARKFSWEKTADEMLKIFADLSETKHTYDSS